MSKPYKYQTNKTSPNKNKGRFGNKISSITIHHWGSTGQKHANVVSWLCDRRAGTSAHYVVSDGLVTCIVDPDDTAWHSGNRVGNRTSIGIECRPEMSAGDFETVAQLIAGLRKTYGNLPLKGHKQWKNTACPGKWYAQLGKLSARANEIRKGSSAKPSTSKPAPKPAAKGKLVVDGRLGALTAKALQKWVGTTQDGKLGHNSWKKLQAKLGTRVDGVISKQSYKASEIGTAITQGWDYTGRRSSGSTVVKALQKQIGAEADGVWGEGTTKKLQTFLNKG